MRPRKVSMIHRKLKSVIQVEYLGSSEPDLRSGSAKTTSGLGLLWCCKRCRHSEKRRHTNKCLEFKNNLVYHDSVSCMLI